MLGWGISWFWVCRRIFWRRPWRRCFRRCIAVEVRRGGGGAVDGEGGGGGRMLTAGFSPGHFTSAHWHLSFEEMARVRGRRARRR